MHFRCARADWRPPIAVVGPGRRCWLRANSSPPPHLFLFLFHCLSLLLVCSAGLCSADGAELAPAEVEKSSLETYNLAAASESASASASARRSHLNEESLLPAKRTNNFLHDSADDDDDDEEQLPPILFSTATNEETLLLPLTSSSNVTGE